MENETILLKKWYLSENGYLTVWVPHNFHTSKSYYPIKTCYSGKTNSFHTYGTSINGLSAVDSLEIEYQYIIPLTQIKQRKVKWRWQGLYGNNFIVEFNIEEHIQEDYPEQRQSLKQINDIITKLNQPVKEEYNQHNFRFSEGIVLCQHCGELLSELKKNKSDSLPSCRACCV